MPSRYLEDQFLVNLDWIVTPKNTLSERVFWSRDPQTLSIDCGAKCLPGNPGLIKSNNFNGVLKLTSILTPNLVNEVRAGFTHSLWHDSSFQFATPQQFGMTPLNSWLDELPTITDQWTFHAGRSRIRQWLFGSNHVSGWRSPFLEPWKTHRARGI